MTTMTVRELFDNKPNKKGRKRSKNKEKNKLTRWNITIRTADDFVLSKPLGVDGTEQTEWHHCVLTVKDVVDEALEVVCVVTVGHDVRRVGGGHAERMRKLVRLLRKRCHLLQTRFVAQIFKVGMVGRDARRIQELDHSRIEQRIEIAAQQQLRVRRIRFVTGSEGMAHSILRQLFQLLNQPNPIENTHSQI